MAILRRMDRIYYLEPGICKTQINFKNHQNILDVTFE